MNECRICDEPLLTAAAKEIKSLREALNRRPAPPDAGELVLVPEFTFNEVLEFLEAQEDVMDGTDGPRPNAAMRLATDLRALLAARRGRT